jgi:hypothetical protein
MNRDQTERLLMVGAYAFGLASLVLFEPLVGTGAAAWFATELGLLAVWALMLAGCFVASWKLGLLALPSALFALALPVGFMIALSSGGLS